MQIAELEKARKKLEAQLSEAAESSQQAESELRALRDELEDQSSQLSAAKQAAVAAAERHEAELAQLSAELASLQQAASQQTAAVPPASPDGESRAHKWKK